MDAAPRIYVDFDDVLCETARTLMALAHREFGRELSFERIHTFDIGEAFGLAPPQVARMMEFLHDHDIVTGYPVMEGAVPALAAWRARGYRLEIVTGRPPATEPACHEWLARHAVPYDGIVFVDKYGRFVDDGAGAPCLSLDELAAQPYCLAVDDSLETALYLARHSAIPVALFDRPWNATAPADLRARRPMHRCRGWAGVMDRFPDPARHVKPGPHFAQASHAAPQRGSPGGLALPAPPTKGRPPDRGAR